MRRDEGGGGSKNASTPYSTASPTSKSGRRGEKRTHSPIGTLVSHFLAGVYWAPLSICSQSVRSSYAPPVAIVFSNGRPVIWWKMRYETFTEVTTHEREGQVKVRVRENEKEGTNGHVATGDQRPAQV